MMQFTATIALGLAPLVVFGGAALLRPAPPVPVKPVQTESVRAQRMDTETFRARWQPVYLPPMRNEVRDRSTVGRTGEAKASSPTNRDDGSMFAPATSYSLPRGGDATHSQETGKPVEVAARPPPPAVRIVKRASLRPDVCARHGLHKQFYTGSRGWQRWRCRR